MKKDEMTDEEMVLAWMKSEINRLKKRVDRLRNRQQQNQGRPIEKNIRALRFHH